MGKGFTGQPFKAVAIICVCLGLGYGIGFGAGCLIKWAKKAPQRRAVEFLYSSMPLADSLDHSVEYYRANVEAAYRARKQTIWGKSIPEREWRHFVLPVRVNNENLDDFRTTYSEELLERVEGMSMEQAALEINHWCHEKVTYTPTDSRTSAPMATVVNAKGRCGEESVLLVAALRTVAIPARQVYTPRWAHTDDNHAWVEAWIDGQWHYMGACEPEPLLDVAWFTSTVTRAMLMDTKVFGDYDGPEDVISRDGGITEINVIGNYVPTRNSVVKVTDTDGKAVEGAKVEYKIYNYAEFYTVASRHTGPDGCVCLTTGIGDLLAWASFGERFGLAKIEGENTVVTLDRKSGEPFEVEFEITPPEESTPKAVVTKQQKEANDRRLASEDSIRLAYEATFFDPESEQAADGRIALLLSKARGNWKQIRTFIENAPSDRRDDALALLESISEKDLRDTPADVLLDHLANSPSASETAVADLDLYYNFILCPRIANERISCWRSAIRNCESISVESLSANPESIVGWCRDNIRIDNSRSPYNILASPAGVLAAMKADDASRDLLAVAVLRTCGVPARIDRVTGKPQLFDGEWKDLDFGSAGKATAAPHGLLRTSYSPTRHLADPQYYRHFTLAKIYEGSAHLLDFEEGDATELGALASWSTLLDRGYNLDEGFYLLTSGTRKIDGGVVAHLDFLNIEREKVTSTELVMPQIVSGFQMIGSADPEAPFTPLGASSSVSLLSRAGRGFFIVAIVGAHDEPSNHAIRELGAMSGTLGQWGRPVVLLGRSRWQLAQTDLSAMEGVNLICGVDNGNAILNMLSEACDSQGTLPVICLMDSFGRIFYYSEGYNTSLASDLARLP